MNRSIAASDRTAPSAYAGDPSAATHLERALPEVAISALPGYNRRRRRRVLSLLLAVLLPVALVGVYLYGFAADQYISEFRFSIRHQTPLRIDVMAAPSATSALSGPAAAMAVITDSQTVVQYLKSRQIIDDVIASGVDLDAIFAGDDSDFLAHLGRSASVEKRQRYWRRMVDPFFDLSTGIVSVEVRAFRPVDAQLVARTVLRLSEKLMNDISSRSHDDMVAYAVQVVDDVESKLKAAQTATSDYRNLHAVLFPEMQATADSTVEGTVEQSLIQAKATYNAQLAQGAAKDAVQMTMLRQHIVAIETELQGLHGRLAKTRPGGVPDPSLASVLSGYNMLLLNEQIVAKVYERALIELLDARSAASQQSVYLAAFVRPGLPQDSMYPVRWRVMLETALLSFVGWCLLQLLYHGVRDHID